MKRVKICPLFLVFFKTENIDCIEDRCALWSDIEEGCSIKNQSEYMRDVRKFFSHYENCRALLRDILQELK